MGNGKNKSKMTTVPIQSEQVDLTGLGNAINDTINTICAGKLVSVASISGVLDMVKHDIQHSADKK